jgi:hypothetical protein
MRVGTIISVPDINSTYGRIKDVDGRAFTVEKSEIPENTSVGDEFAYKVDIYSNESGLAYALKED